WDGERAPRAVCRAELLGNGLGSLEVEIGDHDVCSEACEPACAGAADSASGARDERDSAGELAAGGGLAQLVALERPVLDRERLLLAERAEATRGLGCVLDGDRAVIQVAGES